MAGYSAEGDPGFGRAVLPGCAWVLEALAQTGSDSSPFREGSGRRRLANAMCLLGRMVRSRPDPTDPTLRRIHARIEFARAEGHDGWGLERMSVITKILFGETGLALLGVERCARLAPGFADRVRFEACRLLIELGHLDEAASILEPPPRGRGESAEYVLAMAAFERRSGRPEVARRRLEAPGRNLYASDNDDWEMERALALWGTGRHRLAVERFEALCRRQPTSAVAQRNLVVALFASGRRGEAEAALASARPTVKAHPDVRRWLGDPARAEPRAPALDGELSAVPLTDLLGLLGQTRASGALVMISPAGRGEVHLAEGRLVDARAPAVTRSVGEQDEAGVLAALEELLAWEHGRFRFEAGPPRSRGGSRSVVAIETPVALLHACASLDERRRAEAQ